MSDELKVIPMAMIYPSQFSSRREGEAIVEIQHTMNELISKHNKLVDAFMKRKED
jgi:hypothetical protein